eukprot:gb/GECG01011465.1/.p1 GENE.gb/GECG01011465.1/~~gb/GECG01011465.1/.p1  ORF type:complete len:422 (+),score=50.92 gb/GECG01011465.1/:1-1266(+)
MYHAIWSDFYGTALVYNFNDAKALWRNGYYGKNIYSRGFEPTVVPPTPNSSSTSVANSASRPNDELKERRFLYYASNFTKHWIRHGDPRDVENTPFQVSKKRKTIKEACEESTKTATIGKIDVAALTPEQISDLPFALLTPEETCYLANVKQELKVCARENDALLETEKLWDTLILHNGPNFLQRYKVYERLRSDGWIVRPGFNYGADFVIYVKDVEKEHAKACIKIYSHISSYAYQYIPEMQSWSDLLGNARIASSISKNLAIATVQGELENKQTISWDQLDNLSVSALIVRRVSPEAGSEKGESSSRGRVLPQEKVHERQITSTFVEGRPLSQLVYANISKNQQKQARRRFYTAVKNVRAVECDFREGRWENYGDYASEKTLNAISQLYNPQNDHAGAEETTYLQGGYRCWYPREWGHP